MKILLFTHGADIDGLNALVLAKLAFRKIDYVLCETQGLDIKFMKKKNTFKNYDYLFIIDLFPSNDILEMIENSNLKDKVKVFDHHQGSIDQLNNQYDFVILKVKDDNGKCCGTSLFYQFLIDHKYLKDDKFIDELVTLTTLYDTWLWRKYHKQKACDLTYLFYALGTELYLDNILTKLKNKSLIFNNQDIIKITNWKKDFDLKIKKIIKKMIYLIINNYKMGLVFTPYEYRNDIAIYLKDHKYDLDIVAMVMEDKDSVSYRAIKDGVDVNKIAQKYGGKGHQAAASSPITKKEKENIKDYFK